MQPNTAVLPLHSSQCFCPWLLSEVAYWLGWTWVLKMAIFNNCSATKLAVCLNYCAYLSVIYYLKVNTCTIIFREVWTTSMTFSSVSLNVVLTFRPISWVRLCESFGLNMKEEKKTSCSQDYEENFESRNPQGSKREVKSQEQPAFLSIFQIILFF